jgi:hypothetical protein
MHALLLLGNFFFFLKAMDNQLYYRTELASYLREDPLQVKTKCVYYMRDIMFHAVTNAIGWC